MSIRGVLGLPSRKDLCHVAEVSLHSVLLDTGSVGSQCAYSDKIYKYLEIWDGVVYPGEVWGDGKTFV